MAFVIDNLGEAIRNSKKVLRQALPNHTEVFRQVEAEMRRRVNDIVKERETGQPVIPIVHYSDVKAGAVPAELIAKIKDCGACVVRKTFEPEQA
ncbi:MAG TPA: YbiU family protein, partial [Acidobacteriaceae bacterium]|nr:YbiU family protein [Acidobacteriaceae bacterium]